MPVILGAREKGRKRESGKERQREFGGKGNRLGTRMQGNPLSSCIGISVQLLISCIVLKVTLRMGSFPKHGIYAEPCQK